MSEPSITEATLWVSGSYSQCGACGRNADPSDVGDVPRSLQRFQRAVRDALPHAGA